MFSALIYTVLLALIAGAGCEGCGQGANGSARSISNRILYPGEGLRAIHHALFGDDRQAPAGCEDFIRFHPADFPKPVAHVPIPQHPFMAANGAGNMHCDASMSDTYAARGPEGPDTQVRSRTQGFGGYGTIAFDSRGRLVTVFTNARTFQLELMDPHTLQESASYDLSPRPWYFLLQGVMPWEYIGAGMYFYLDDRDRAVVPTTDSAIQVIQVPGPESDGNFELVRRYDLSGHVAPMKWPKRDSIAWVLPDWGGAYFWYATTGGTVGTVDMETGAVRALRLVGESIENSFAVGPDGVFIVSDRALYRFSQDGNGEVTTDWRMEYDRGPAKKPGHITRGSGTSVTLLGGTDGYVVIADNAEPRIHLIFFRRSDGLPVCRLPVFQEGRSGTDISVAGFEHADANGVGTGTYSVVVENNWGNSTFPRSRPEPGLTRVDLTRSDDGTHRCKQVWASTEKGICVFKLSLGSGLVYSYWRSEVCPTTQWYFKALDFATGETVYRKRTGQGLGYNNWAGALFLHPSGGIAYSTTIFGLVMIRDGSP